MSRPARRRRAIAGLLGGLTFAAPLSAAPAAADDPAVDVVPGGTTTLIEGGGWSWFEDARAVYSADGGSFYVSAVTGEDTAAGAVVLTELDLEDGTRRLVDLGTTESDDHNSASIIEAAPGELTTSWSRHFADRFLHTARRRTDGSWLRLPPMEQIAKTTYSNLHAATAADGTPLLYDFFRGDRFDPEAIVSTDVGRTWSRLGRVLRDPANSIAVRPYVQYSSDGAGRIDLVATEAHPASALTSIYHGYIQAGQVFDSAGEPLGPVGSAIPVTSLTRVWKQPGDERGWTGDVFLDPASHEPVVAFSSRVTADDHRYWYGRWDGTAWAVEEIAYAGDALYAAAPDYTGLVALDPSDPDHLVISTNVEPATGDPRLSLADGQPHWELYDGWRQPGGAWTWTALTSDSSVDNVRPVLTVGPDGAQALLWLRGTYQSYLDYDLDVVGRVERPGGGPVAAGSATVAPVVDVLATPPPRVQLARPVVGQFDGHPADDVFLPRSGGGSDDLFLGDDQRHLTRIAGRSVSGAYTPIAGDFDGDGRGDVFWYAPGTAVDGLWTSSDTGVFRDRPTQAVNGTYTPIPGDYDGNGTTDIFWYAPGAATDHLWLSTGTAFVAGPARQVAGTYTPAAGDFDGDGHGDIYWSRASGGSDGLWTSSGAATFLIRPARQMTGPAIPVAGDFGGDGRSDLFWYAPGTATDHLWAGTSAASFTAQPALQVRGTFTPIPGDLDGDGRDDIHWYAPGPTTDYLWWSAAGPLADTEVAAVNL